MTIIDDVVRPVCGHERYDDTINEHVLDKLTAMTETNDMLIWILVREFGTSSLATIRFTYGHDSCRDPYRFEYRLGSFAPFFSQS